MKKFIVITFILFILGTGYSLPKVTDILKSIDTITELKTDGSAKVTITEQKAGQGTKLLKSIYYRKDDTDQFLIIFTHPESEKGNGYLKEGENFWMYRRNTRTFQHINRDESIAGTNSSSGDFEKKKLNELYKPDLTEDGKEIIKESKLGKIPVYTFTVIAKEEDVTYPKRKYWVRKDNFLPLKTENYSLSGTLMQTNYFLKYTKIQGKYLWIKGIFIDEFEKGNKTIVEIKNISIKTIDKSIFTKAYLESLSK